MIKTQSINWVENTAGDKTTLNLYEGDNEKVFVRSDETKTIILEKYDGKWMPIKEAIRELIKEAQWTENKIKIKGDSETSIEKTSDDKLTGLLKHLKDKYEEETKNTGEQGEYEKQLDNAGTGLTFEKKDESSNQWGKVEDKPSQEAQ